MSIINQDISIAALERETGISKDVLRKWETRYGFPCPRRDARGARFYPLEQVERIKLVKRLLDRGLRPARLLGLDSTELTKIAESAEGAGRQAYDPFAARMVVLLSGHEAEALREELECELARRGLEDFVVNVVAPLNEIVGDAWYRGELRVHEEHLYTATLRSVLGAAIAALPLTTQTPRVLLATPPGELHELGLLMARAVFSLHGAGCLDLATQVPVLELAAASTAYAADVVALSFSSAYPARRIAPYVGELRNAIPARVEIWIGGAGTRRATGLPEGIRRFLALPPAIVELKQFLQR